jgi:hypothetical protein
MTSTLEKETGKEEEVFATNAEQRKANRLKITRSRSKKTSRTYGRNERTRGSSKRESKK